MLGVKDINNIDLQDDNSGFLDEDLKDNKVGSGGMLDFIKSKNDILDEANSKKSMAAAPGISSRTQISSNNDYKISERKVDEFLSKGIQEDNDSVSNLLQKQINFFKKEIKEKEKKLNLLSELFKELLKQIKCDNKNKSTISKISNLLFP